MANVQKLQCVDFVQSSEDTLSAPAEDSENRNDTSSHNSIRRPQTQRRNSSSSWCTASPELLEQFDEKVKEAVEAAKEAARVERDEAIHRAIYEYHDNVVKPMSENLELMLETLKLMSANVNQNAENVNRNLNLLQQNIVTLSERVADQMASNTIFLEIIH
jgi:hypothetical protein